MRIIITGGSGLIGRTLIPQLAADGHELVVLCRRPESVHLPGSAQVAVWDGRSSDGWLHLVEGAGAIINLAGENIGAGSWTAEKKRRIITSRSQAGIAIVSAVRQVKNGPRLLLQASAIGCYGVSEKATFDETSPFGSDYLSQVCVGWEDSTKEVDALGVRRVILRTGLFLDRREGVLPKLMLPFRLFVGGPLGNGRQWYSWIHPHDYVEAVRFFIANESASGIYNLTAPEPVSMGEFGRTLAVVMGRPYLIPVPGFALHLALGERSTLVLDGQRVVPKRLLEQGFHFKYKKLHDALVNILKS